MIFASTTKNKDDNKESFKTCLFKNLQFNNKNLKLLIFKLNIMLNKQIILQNILSKGDLIQNLYTKKNISKNGINRKLKKYSNQFFIF